MRHREVIAAAGRLTPAEVLGPGEPAPPPGAPGRGVRGAGPAEGVARAGGRGLWRPGGFWLGLFSPRPWDLTLSWDYLWWRFEPVRRGGSRPEGARRVAGSWEPARALVVLGRRDVSAVLCGPGERGWVPRGVGGSETRPGA